MIPTLFVGIYLVIFCASGYAFAQCARFVRRHPSIDSPATLESFKALARGNMKLTLLLLPLYGLGILLSVVLTLKYGLFGLLGMLAANVVLGVFGFLGMQVEKKARSLPAVTVDLQQEHRRVSESWVKKALPDF